MSGSLHSTSWYRVAGLRPKLREHARLHRHHYRGQRWYVLRDPSSGRCHRLSATAHQLIGLMDGRRTTQEIWDICVEQLGDDVPTQDETIRLLGLLHMADVLRCDVTPDTEDLLRRGQRKESQDLWQRMMSPFSIRFPLFDPDTFLERWAWLVSPVFTRVGLAVWLAVVATGLVLGALHAGEIASDPSLVIFEGRGFWLLFVLYPIVKALHEFGHAFAAKSWGAEVHEMGVSLLVFMPVPYVDASAVSVFPSKYRRMAVSAAGIGVELFLAAAAVLVWTAVEPGLVRGISLQVMLICGASTLLFNGNPLIRFDGYYVLMDAIEIPNFYARSSQYLEYFVERHLLGLEAVRNPVVAAGETAWFIVYGVAAFFYRVTLTLAIAWLVAGKFFIVGVTLAIFAVGMQIVLPVVKGILFVLANPRLDERRARAFALSFGLALAAAAVAVFVPAPLHTRAEGVVWMPEHAQVRAATDAFVTRVLVATDTAVKQGDPLLVTDEPLLEARVAVLAAQRTALVRRAHVVRHENLVQYQLLLEELEVVDAELIHAREQAREVVIRSPADGVFVIPGSDLPLDRFVKKGDLIGYVVSPGNATVRVAIPQADIDLVRERTERVEARLASRVGRVEPAVIQRQVPAAIDQLPSAALGQRGGGLWAVDPTDESGTRTLEPSFQLDIRLERGTDLTSIGERVFVRFSHGMEPVAQRIHRAIRRTFLSRLGI